ncbi:MAG: M48 family metalloprotease [Thermodesulfobacteriota bacterium]
MAAPGGGPARQQRGWSWTGWLALALVALAAGGCVSSQARYAAPVEGMAQPGGQGPWPLPAVAPGELASLQPGQRPALATDEAGIWMVMDRTEEEYKEAGNRITDPELAAYLQEVVCRLTPEYCADIRVYALRVPYFNATMAPNGALVVWSGLLLRVHNEAQLASVLGHEIGHYLRRHALERMRDVVNTTNVLAFVRLAAAAAGVGVAGDLATLAAAGGLSAYSRDQEREADGYGLALMARAGYDPRQAAALWRQVIAEKDAGEDKTFSLMLFDSHPPSEERLAALDELAGRLVAGGREGSLEQERYQAILAPHWLDLLQDELHLRQFGRTEVLLSSLAQAGTDPGRLRFGAGELHRLRNQAGDRALALAAYTEAIAAPTHPAEAHRAQALLLRERGEAAQAREAFHSYLAERPAAPDREMILHMLTQETP